MHYGMMYTVEVDFRPAMYDLLKKKKKKKPVLKSEGLQPHKTARVDFVNHKHLGG